MKLINTISEEVISQTKLNNDNYRIGINNNGIECEIHLDSIEIEHNKQETMKDNKVFNENIPPMYLYIQNL